VIRDPTASSTTRKSRRPRDGRLRAGRQAVGRRPDPGRFEFQLLPGGLGPVRAVDDQRDPSHAVPRDRARSSCC
jgi:hypothetical protein